MGPLPSIFTVHWSLQVDNSYELKGQSHIDFVRNNGFQNIMQQLKLPWFIFFIKLKTPLVYTFQGLV
jgi:hypothetical protein